MKRIAPPLLISLSLLSTPVLATGLQASKQVMVDNQGKVLVLNYDGGYVASGYTQQDLDNFKSQIYKQNETIKELKDKLYRMERDNSSSNNLSGQLKEQSRNLEKIQRDIIELQRKFASLSSKVK